MSEIQLGGGWVVVAPSGPAWECGAWMGRHGGSCGVRSRQTRKTPVETRHREKFLHLPCPAPPRVGCTDGGPDSASLSTDSILFIFLSLDFGRSFMG